MKAVLRAMVARIRREPLVVASLLATAVVVGVSQTTGQTPDAVVGEGVAFVALVVRVRDKVAPVVASTWTSLSTPVQLPGSDAVATGRHVGGVLEGYHPLAAPLLPVAAELDLSGMSATRIST